MYRGILLTHTESFDPHPVLAERVLQASVDPWAVGKDYVVRSWARRRQIPLEIQSSMPGGEWTLRWWIKSCFATFLHVFVNLKCRSVAKLAQAKITPLKPKVPFHEHISHLTVC